MDALIVVNDLNTNALSPRPDETFPPIGEAEQQTLPEGESIAHDESENSEASLYSGKLLEISLEPSTPAPLLAQQTSMNDAALADEDDWLLSDLSIEMV